MIKYVQLVSMVFLMAYPVMTQCQAAEDSSRAFSSLFNGIDLAGWKVPATNLFWRVENGILVGENDAAKKGSMLYTQKSYSNFVFQVEARWSGEIDSGVMVRRPELQLQIGVSRSLKKDMTASFYTGGKDAYPASGRAQNMEKVLKPGDWNLIRVEVKGNTFTTWVNGVKVSDYTDAKYKEGGPIGLQIHPNLAMKVEFRNIQIKDLDPQS